MSNEAVGMLGLWVIVGTVCGVIAANIASNKHRSVGGFLLLGFLFPVLGVVVSILVPPGTPPAPAGMRPVTCPRCNAQQNVGVDQAEYECWQCKTKASAAH
ncbi:MULTISPECIES: hypothetical protein [unclassified Rhodococcus (in: high G+C Gram-positive bacteria)]|uniref:hypothetical protein n=1 Tax=unclassified Rhodococcus (in: high G+C Gram-positive bacteria) TaxID=192944 RepID=UPI000B15FA03|nr:hypothetical protein [Rhodococcus sp. M8]QPG45119.1 hypothetical protein ISO16_25395 [Rhodococcus sp. M8]